MEIKKQVAIEFEKRFHCAPLLVKSPGRINLIGEHTDYNDGFVLPAAIDKYIHVGISKRTDDEIHLFSLEYNEEHLCSLSNLTSPDKQWPLYILGVVAQINKTGKNISGFNLAMHGDVPIGAGMSSSAAVECACAFALNELFSLGFSKIELVKMAQLAEHEYAGVKCGIMDQFASMFGKENSVIQLDCRSLEYQYVPFNMKGIKIVLLDTKVKHSLASSAYNERRTQCETGVALVKTHIPSVNSLRDINLAMLNDFVKDSLVHQRCRFVVEEIARLQSACIDLEKNDLISFGKKMFDTHYGLSKLYEVSCEELDCLVDAVKDNSNVYGARMMGGGFGGCTINIVKDDAVDAVIADAAKQYKEKLGKDLSAYVVSIVDGTSAS